MGLELELDRQHPDDPQRAGQARWPTPVCLELALCAVRATTGDIDLLVDLWPHPPGPQKTPKDQTR